MEPINFFIENKMIFVIVHVFSVVIGMGSALISDILFTFFSKDKVINQTEKKTLNILATTVLYSLLIMILSGIFIFFSDPAKYIVSQKFISKMILVVILIFNGYFLHKIVQPALYQKGFLKFKSKKKLRQIAFACGAISLTTWPIIFVLGMLNKINIHFSKFILGYLVLIFFAIIFSLFIEKREFGEK